MARSFATATILDAKGATGWGTVIPVNEFRHLSLSFGTASSANMTVKFAGSASKDKPDFTAVRSVSNHWDYVNVVDLQSGSSIAGDTGIALTGTDDFRNLVFNVDGLHWINVEVFAWSAGTVTVKTVAYENT